MYNITQDVYNNQRKMFGLYLNYPKIKTFI